ncbi:MAG: hypothetical protein E6J77_03395 [Deltaproteobacteria bacterium]|nr:MAG: hypothetical protein E6J77_03395 [Deltaproteobacteria bacterium]
MPDADSLPALPKKKRRRRIAYLRSGLYAKHPELPGPDTLIGQALRERKEALIADLGGAESCSTALLAMVDLIVAAWWQLDSVTAYLLTLPSLCDKRHRRVWQVVRDRATLASQLQSLLREIGLKRVPKAVPTLEEYIAGKDAEQAEQG